MRLDLKLRKIMKKKGIKNDVELGEFLGFDKPRISNTMSACARIEGWIEKVSAIEDKK